jgi:hypothetical protein
MRRRVVAVQQHPPADPALVSRTTISILSGLLLAFVFTGQIGGIGAILAGAAGMLGLVSQHLLSQVDTFHVHVLEDRKRARVQQRLEERLHKHVNRPYLLRRRMVDMDLMADVPGMWTPTRGYRS